MTATRTRDGAPLHFPGNIRDSISVIEPPPPDEVRAIAEQVHPDALLLFARGLLRGAHKRRFSDRWFKVNVARMELASLCIERAKTETLAPCLR